jgi:hypothetical protein
MIGLDDEVSDDEDGDGDDDPEIDSEIYGGEDADDGFMD